MGAKLNVCLILNKRLINYFFPVLLFDCYGTALNQEDKSCRCLGLYYQKDFIKKPTLFSWGMDIYN
jgi:hypothetical protein